MALSNWFGGGFDLLFSAALAALALDARTTAAPAAPLPGPWPEQDYSRAKQA